MTMTMPATATETLEPLELDLFSGDAFYDLSPISHDCTTCPDGGFVVPYRAAQGVVVELRCLRHGGNFAGTRT